MENSIDWKLVDRYLAGEASEAEAERVEAWMGSRTVGPAILAGLADGEDSWDVDDAWSSVRRRISGEASREARPSDARTGWRWTPLRTAAAVVLALGTMAIWSSSRTWTPLEVATGPLGQDTIVLDDGSRVVLGRDSRIRFPRSFSGAERRVEMEGIGFFDVVRDEGRPFRVVANGSLTEVLGTEFTVQAYHGATSVEVSVMSGSVSLRAEDGVEAEGVVLSPGQVGRLEAGAVEISEPASFEERSGWMEGRLVILDEPLDAAVEHIEHWFGVDITIRDARLRDEGVTYLGPQDASLDDALDTIMFGLGAEWERDGDAVFLGRAGGGGN